MQNSWYFLLIKAGEGLSTYLPSFYGFAAKKEVIQKNSSKDWAGSLQEVIAAS